MAAKIDIEHLPYPAVDPLGFLVDDEIRPFVIDKRHDITAPNAPVVSNGIFIVHEHTVPDDTAEVIHGVFNHCWRRSNPGSPQESVEMLDPRLVAGWVSFDNSKASNQPYEVEIDYNIPIVSTAVSPVLNDKNRTEQLRGTTFLSLDGPLVENVGWRNPYSTIYLPAKSKFRVLFRLVPTTAFIAGPPPTGGVPNPWVIPDYADATQSDTENRIDFAGALVFGLRMPQQVYEHLKIARRKGQLGPEGSSVDDPIGTSTRK